MASPSAPGSALRFDPVDLPDGHQELRADVRAFVAAAIAEFGAIDYLVNKAGINTDLRNLHDIPLETWQEVVEINLNSVYYVIRELLPHLRSNQQGHIINIISGAGYSLRPNATSGVAYIASKHGVTGSMCRLTSTS